MYKNSSPFHVIRQIAILPLSLLMLALLHSPAKTENIAKTLATRPVFSMPIPKEIPDLGKALEYDTTPDHILKALRNIPYRDDGAIDEYGSFTLFSEPDKKIQGAGLNCSGLLLEACRFLLHTNYSLASVQKDRNGDSGAQSPQGQDWDFGWDLLMNISDGFPRTFILPQGKTLKPEVATALDPLGFDLHSEQTWQELPGRIRSGYIYLVSFNMENRRKGYGLVHYHVALIHRNADGEIWMTDTTSQAGRSGQRLLSDPTSLKTFLQAFANKGKNRKKMLVLEVRLPQRQ